MEKWRFLDTDQNTGVFNMAVDEAILNLRLHGLAPPTLRVYTWKPPCLSIGRRQKLDNIDLDLNRCKELKIDVVRRLTGGAADLHKTELTYSVIFSPKESVLARQSYETVCQGITAAYKILGVNLKGGFQKIDSPICFFSKGLTDLTYNGKKLIGSVQLRKAGVILQHGSLIVKHHPEILFSIFKFPSEEVREKECLTFLENTTSLSEIIGEVDLTEFKGALLKGFQQVFNIEFFEGKLTEDEIREVERLLEKYKKLDWREDERKTS